MKLTKSVNFIKNEVNGTYYLKKQNKTKKSIIQKQICIIITNIR